MSTQSRGGIPLTEQIEIHKYKIKGDNDEYLDRRYHHVPEHLTSEFEELVISLGKQLEFKPSLTYHQDKEEYETKPENKDNVYHSLYEINRQELGDILDPIEIHYFGVKNSQALKKLRFYVPFSSVDSFKQHLEREGYTFVAFYGKRPFSTARYQELCEAPPPDIIPIRIGAYENDLAREFEEELTKRNINKEDLTMTTATLTNTETEVTEIQFDEEQLSLYLKKCTREFLDELILTFGLQGVKALDFAHSTKAKRATAYDLMLVDRNVDKFKAVKEFYDLVVGNAAQMKEALETFQAARNEYQATKDSYESRLNARVKSLGTQFKVKKEHRKQYSEILGKLQRTKVIKKGLKAYGTAVAVAHVDNIQDQIIASAAYVAAKTSELAKKEKLDDKTLQGTENLVDKLTGKIDNLIANVQTEDGQPNALANRLVAETKTQMGSLNTQVNKTAQEVPQTAKS